jgi:hypothetical protein
MHSRRSWKEGRAWRAGMRELLPPWRVPGAGAGCRVPGVAGHYIRHIVRTTLRRESITGGQSDALRVTE